MARPKIELDIDLKVEFVAIDPDALAAWRADMLFLLELLREERSLQKAENGREPD